MSEAGMVNCTTFFPLMTTGVKSMAVTALLLSV